MYLVQNQITYYFKFLMIKSISLIALTHFFQFNFNQVTYFFKLNQQYFFFSVG